MKRIIFIIAILLVSRVASAEWYVFNTDNRCIAKIKYQPDSADLASRDEMAVFDSVKIDIEDAEYHNGKVKVRAKSQEEKNAELDLAEEAAEMAVVYHVMFREAYKKAYEEGGSFTKLDKHVTDINEEKSKIDKKKSDFLSAKAKLIVLGLTADEVDSLK